MTLATITVGVSSIEAVHATSIARAPIAVAATNFPPADVTLDATASCPCTLFGSATPSVPDSGDAGANVELGVKFYPDTDGYISGVRYYKSAANTGTHTGSLWGLLHGEVTGSVTRPDRPVWS